MGHSCWARLGVINKWNEWDTGALERLAAEQESSLGPSGQGWQDGMCLSWPMAANAWGQVYQAGNIDNSRKSKTTILGPPLPFPKGPCFKSVLEAAQGRGYGARILVSSVTSSPGLSLCWVRPSSLLPSEPLYRAQWHYLPTQANFSRSISYTFVHIIIVPITHQEITVLLNLVTETLPINLGSC